MNELKTSPNYFKIFSSLSFILIALFSIVLFFMQTHSMKLTLRNIAEDRAAIISQQLSQIISVEFLMPHLLSQNEVNMNDPATLRQLDELIRSHFKNQNIARVILYDENSMITYSTYHKIGRDASENAGVQGALDGQTYSKIVNQFGSNDFDIGGDGIEGKIIETYIPFSFKFMDQSIKGVLEIYQDIAENEARINKLNRFFLILILIISASLYILLLLTTTQIEKKRTALVRQLSDKNNDLKQSEEALKISEAKTRTILASMGEGIINTLASTDLTIDFVNQETCNIFGYLEGELLGQSLTILIPDKYRADHIAGVKRYLSKGNPKILGKHIELEGLRKDGSTFPLELKVEEAKNEGANSFFIAAVRDVTERKNAEDKLRLYAKIYENTIEAVIITDKDGVIQYVNPASFKIMGYTAEELIGRKPSMWKSEIHNKDFFESMWKSLLEKGTWDGEIWNKRKDRSVFAAHMNISAIKNYSGQTTQYAAIYYDLTSIKKSEKKIQHLALHDALTGLANRTLFQDRLLQTINRAKRSKSMFAILFIDLDNFKHINDTMGHQAGDKLLQELSKRLLTCGRKDDTASRLGGDEFALILDSIEFEKEAGTVAERVIKTFSVPYKIQGMVIDNTVSIGIAIYPLDGNQRRR